MRQTLSITHEINVDGQRGMANMHTVEAETDWSLECPTSHPKRVCGQLLNIPPDDLTELRFAEGVVIYFKARRYRFEALEQDGNFILCRDW